MVNITKKSIFCREIIKKTPYINKKIEKTIAKYAEKWYTMRRKTLRSKAFVNYYFERKLYL